MGEFVRKLKKLFGKDISESTDTPTEKSIHLPEQEEPIDVAFARSFAENALGFLYVQDEVELLEGLQQMSEEFQVNHLLALDEKLQSLLTRAKLSITNNADSKVDAFISTCEFLVAYNGSVVLCNRQTGGRRWSEMPDMHVIIGYTHQLVPKMGDAMSGIRKFYGEERPEGITSVGGITINSDQRSSLIPEEKGKKLFLFLVESPNLVEP